MHLREGLLGSKHSGVRGEVERLRGLSATTARAQVDDLLCRVSDLGHAELHAVLDLNPGLVGHALEVCSVLTEGLFQRRGRARPGLTA